MGAAVVMSVEDGGVTVVVDRVSWLSEVVRWGRRNGEDGDVDVGCKSKKDAHNAIGICRKIKSFALPPFVPLAAAQTQPEPNQY
ncbi:hypothetical protein Tco_1039405 [Tanacetum coccineum]